MQIQYDFSLMIYNFINYLINTQCLLRVLFLYRVAEVTASIKPLKYLLKV